MAYKRNIKLPLNTVVLPEKTKKIYTRQDYLNDFEVECKAELELTTRKNHDYGGHSDPFKNFRLFGELGILVRMSDKFSRLITAIHEQREFKVSEETIDDTIRDLSVYTKILKIYRKRKNEPYS